MNLKAKLVAALLLLGGALPHEAGAQNPIVQTCYTSDPAPMVHDGTLYVYKLRLTSSGCRNGACILPKIW